jgi:hypothetical protein
MGIPNCNYISDNKEYYVDRIINDDYIPYVYGFVISIASIGLITSIYNTNIQYKKVNKSTTNKIKLILLIILILVFLGLIGYSGYKLGNYTIKDLTIKYEKSELITPCFSKYNKNFSNLDSRLLNKTVELKIQFVTSDGKNVNESNLMNFKSYTSNEPNLVTTGNKSMSITSPYNTRLSTSNTTITTDRTPNSDSTSATVDASGTSTSVIGNSVDIKNNSQKPVSTIGEINYSNPTTISTNEAINEQTGSSLLDANGNLRV